MDEAFLDIEVHFAEILSQNWSRTTDNVDTVCATLEDYFEDYSYLRPRNFERVSRVRSYFSISFVSSNIFWVVLLTVGFSQRLVTFRQIIFIVNTT